jgi:hypothetical protein
MPYDVGLATRLEEILKEQSGFELKKMFGGIGWLLNGNMCIGVYKEWLIIRVGEKEANKIIKQRHVKPMDITGKPMKGWAMVAPEGVEEDKTLEGFTALATEFVKTLPPKT